MTGERPRCTVVVPVYNYASLTRQCLDLLLGSPPATCDVEVVVVDDASTDLTQEVLAAYRDRVRVLTRSLNAGFATACNEGAATGSGEYVVFLNNDTIPEPGWLDALVRYAEAHPRAAVVGSRLLFPDGTVQHAGVVVCRDLGVRHVYVGFPAEHPAVNRSRRFQMVTAACVLCRRSAFDEAGGFDPAFVNGYEDLDLCLRLGELGYEVHCCHESVVHHLESVSRAGQHDRENSVLFLERWGDRARPDDLETYAEDGLLRIDYGVYPPRLSVSPLLATVEGEGRAQEVERSLHATAGRALELLRDVIALTIRLKEAELGAEPTVTAELPAAAERYETATALQHGRPQRLGAAPTGPLVSVVLCVRDGAGWLRRVLPRLLAQYGDETLEIVAADVHSADGSVELLRDAGATVVSVTGSDSGRARAAEHATGNVLVFLAGDTLPANGDWLRNLVGPLADGSVTAVCSRILASPDADPLAARDATRSPSGSGKRLVVTIGDRAAYDALSADERRQFLFPRTLSIAMRPETLTRFPLEHLSAVGDVRWARAVLEAGLALQHEPDSIVLRTGLESHLDLFLRGFDEAAADRELGVQPLTASQLVPLALTGIRDDWHYLAKECDLDPCELERLRMLAPLRRGAEVAGRWLANNDGGVPEELRLALSAVYPAASA